MKILFLGAGATGGYFGGRLAEAGVDVAFLVRPARAERLRREPLRVLSPSGDIAIPVTTVTAEDIGSDHDLVVVSCKAYDLDDAIATIAPAIGAQTRILPLLNGLGHLNRLDRAFGATRVLGGLCQIAATLAADGSIHHLNRTHLLVWGARDPDQAPYCAALAETLGRGAFDLRNSDAILLEMWEKWVMLAALAGVTCLMRAPVGDIVAAPDGDAVILETLAECAAIATAAGATPREETMSRVRNLLTEPGSVFAASMLRDVEASSRIEADHIIGDLISRADTLGVFTPRLRTAFCHLKTFENRCRREADAYD